ncbi:MAG: hypothetical protein M3132_07235 [Actinomycetia bacterium]|nr:hypothetical protein [Actinomycetes bacterium]
MRAYRSPLRLFLLGVVGLLLVIAAIDVMFAHRISTEPENNEGVLTTRGQAQQRGDIVWGAVMIGAGTLLFGGGIIELIRRKPVIQIREDGLVAAIGTTQTDVVIPWVQMNAVTSAVIEDEYDGGMRDQLIVDVNDRTGLPDAVVSARWVGSELRIDAMDWTKRVTEIALSAQGALEHSRRVAEIAEMEEPSLVWETSVVATEPSAEIEMGESEEEPS